MSYLKIGEVAHQAGVHLETVRYYERRGLIAEPPRTNTGYRMYDESVINDILWIRQAQAIGFTLQETRQLLALRSGEIWPKERLRYYAEEKIVEIEKKIEQLCEMRALLENAAASNTSLASCPLLRTISEGGRPDGQKD